AAVNQGLEHRLLNEILREVTISGEPKREAVRHREEATELTREVRDGGSRRIRSRAALARLRERVRVPDGWCQPRGACRCRARLCHPSARNHSSSVCRWASG